MGLVKGETLHPECPSCQENRSISSMGLLLWGVSLSAYPFSGSGLEGGMSQAPESPYVQGDPVPCPTQTTFARAE